MKKIDLLTVIVSSATLGLFCLCSLLLIWQYGEIRDDIDSRNNKNIDTTMDYVQQLESGASIDRQALGEHLQANVKTIRAHQDEWLLMRHTLTSFVFILTLIVISHLLFVYTFVKAAITRSGNPRQ